MYSCNEIRAAHQLMQLKNDFLNSSEEDQFDFYLSRLNHNIVDKEKLQKKCCQIVTKILQRYPQLNHVIQPILKQSKHNFIGQTQLFICLGFPGENFMDVVAKPNFISDLKNKMRNDASFCREAAKRLSKYVNQSLKKI